MAAENPITFAKVGVFSLLLAYRLDHDRSDFYHLPLIQDFSTK